MPTLHFRFYEELNDHLPAEKRKKGFFHYFVEFLTVGEALQSFGVPLEEVDLLLVDGRSVDFSWRIRDDIAVSVYPMFESMDIGSLTKLPSRPLRQVRLVLDCHLGKLARHLRLLGFDSLYNKDSDDEELITYMEKEKRIILTRNREILKQKRVTHAYCVHEENPADQTVEIINRLDLINAIQPFTRCLECNTPLEKIKKQDIQDMLPPLIQRDFDLFYHCRGCGRNYWQGSHFKDMQHFVDQIRENSRNDSPTKL